MPNAPSNAASNTNIATGQSPSAAETKQIVLKEIGAKWSKFSEPELSSLKDRDDLVSQVVAKYGLEKSQAQRDVDALMERPPDLTQGPIEVEVASLRPRSAGV
jgi:division protein CdvB (Snf7/Vps24/ESCRT-III family)